MAKFALANGDTFKVQGGILGRHRKQIVITNEDNSNKLAIVAGVAEGVDPKTVTQKGLTIFVNSSVTLFTNADITIKATDGAISEVQVLEVIYK